MPPAADRLLPIEDPDRWGAPGNWSSPSLPAVTDFEPRFDRFNPRRFDRITRLLA